MLDSFSVENIGLADTLQALDKTILDTKNRVQGLINDAVQECYDGSQKDCPYDDSNDDAEHEHLRDSGTMEVGELSGSVSYGTDHCDYVEFGTYKMAAQPYLLPNFEIAKNHFLEALNQ